MGRCCKSEELKRQSAAPDHSIPCCRRLPGCPSLAAGLLQAAVQCPSPDSSGSAGQPSQEAEDLGSQSGSDQQGISVSTDREKLVLNDLMQQVPLGDDTGHASLEESGNYRAWADLLGTEWVTHCSRTEQLDDNVQQRPHRLYVQASPGEMRLATVMFAGA